MNICVKYILLGKGPKKAKLNYSIRINNSSYLGEEAGMVLGSGGCTGGGLWVAGSVLFLGISCGYVGIHYVLFY